MRWRARALAGLLSGRHHEVPDVFDAGAFAYDALTSHDLWRKEAGRLLERLPPGPSPRRLLDLGCGPGMSAFAFAERLGPGSRVTGIDLAVRMVRRARAHRERSYPGLAVDLLVADAKRLPLPAGAFDVAAGHSFLYLLPDPAAVLAEVRRVLAPGGRVVFMEPRAGGSLRRAAPEIVGREAVRQPAAGARLAASAVLWRFYSARVGRLEPDAVCGWLRAAGFRDPGWAPTLGGLGMHCYATVA